MLKIASLSAFSGSNFNVLCANSLSKKGSRVSTLYRPTNCTNVGQNKYKHNNVSCIIMKLYGCVFSVPQVKVFPISW